MAWRELCALVEEAAENKWEIFCPAKVLGLELFSQIHTLPKSIYKLKKVKQLELYGSHLKRIPPEIGEMEALEYFNPYTSYQLHWFPFEIIYCNKLTNSTVSTRALYGNYKNRLPFPNLSDRPVIYEEATLTCSSCKKTISHNQITQLWLTTQIGSDYLPLLANVCSKKCQDNLSKVPKPPPYYWQMPHKGGLNLASPAYSMDEYLEQQKQPVSKTAFNPIQLIRKRWSKK